MNNLIYTLFLILLTTIACNKQITDFVIAEPMKELTTMSEVADMNNITYPTTRKDETVMDDYHGTTIKDPYRWLEDDHSEETMNWVKAQNKVTFDYLHALPGREKLINRLTELWDYPKYSSPFKEGGKYYFFKNDGLQNQSSLYSIDKLDGEPTLILDPNKFSEDGTTSLGGLDFNEAGDKMAYMISEGGSDWRKAMVLDLKTGELLEDKLEWLKFSGIAWYKDGFYYSRYPEPQKDGELSNAVEFHKVYYHKLGEDQSQDKLVHEEPDHPQRNSYANTSEDEKYLFISTSESTSGNALKVLDIESQKMVDIVTGFDHDFNVVDNNGSQILIRTNYKAPNMRVIAVDFNNPAEENWVDVIPEQAEPIRSVSVVGSKMFIGYLKNASSMIKVHDLDGKYLSDLELPGIGTVGGVGGRKTSTEAFYTFTSFTYPSTIFKLDTETLSSEVFRKSEVKFDTEGFITTQEWYTSKDGTKVPVFITHKKGLRLDGSNPTLLYGYGGFDISILPSFSITRLPLLENGGILAIANIRGGGEFGSEWHKAGTLDRKQNVFDDFIGAAEHLIKRNYTSSEKLAIQGGSNGGLLVGACSNQRPDLFAVAFPAVGVMDMLRYHLFTIGWAWATDYGKSDEAEAFNYLIKYSPLHNLENKDYPATLVTTADHDDRVVPAHSFKYAARLQEMHTGDDPVLIRIETSAGHGAGKPTSKIIETAADIYAFMFHNMGEEFNY